MQLLYIAGMSVAVRITLGTIWYYSLITQFHPLKFTQQKKSMEMNDLSSIIILNLGTVQMVSAVQ